MADDRPLQFAPFVSSITPGFWSSFSKLKLNVLGLDDSPVHVVGRFSNNDHPGLPIRFSVDWDAFDKKEETAWNTFAYKGVVINHNTLDGFKQCDKMGLLQKEADHSWEEGIVKGDASQLSRFLILMYCDLKKYQYYYWFAFPAFVLPQSLKVEAGKTKVLKDVLDTSICDKLSSDFRQRKSSNPSLFFAIVAQNGEHTIEDLEAGLESDGEAMIGFADPCTLPEHPGWPLRNLLAYVLKRYSSKVNGLQVVCLRQRASEGRISIGHSPVFKLVWNTKETFDQRPNFVGWEKNDQGKLGPRFVNMRSSMDPHCLSESSVDLNLKLMKWRLVPDLDLDLMSRTKCLLLGSGTLGCNVGRCLLGWGVRNITLVDNAKVSYSNPVRQSLFIFDDCLDGGRHKAVAAAEMLRRVFPGVKTNGVDLTIPMPGHPIADSLLKETREQYEKLEALIKEHDVVFLLMDTRESRWLPTVMAARHQKLVLNAALGFDSYLIMRHGLRDAGSFEADPFDAKVIAGNRLGCYFCNDVVAPGDSTRDRTLDQQCTVTRPGVSYMAGAMAVELMSSVLQHPSGQLAPASTNKDVEAEEGALGVVPHSIRGSIYNFSQFMPTTSLFSHCTACSKKVLDAYTQEGFEFLLKVSESANYLEDLTGLAELVNETNLQDVLEFDDDDSLSVSSN